MTGFSLWWAANRRWLVPALLVLGLVVVAGSLVQGTNCLTAWLAQRHAVKRTSEILTRHAARVEADKPRQRSADSLINHLAGQQAEQHHATQQSKHAYEKATAQLPVIADLPRNPPRYRTGGR